MNIKGHISQGMFLGTLTPLLQSHYFLYPNSFMQYSSYLFFVLMGSVFPDIDLKIKKFSNRPLFIYHRQLTHSLLFFIGMLIFSFNKTILPLYWFSLGVMFHLIGDMLTGLVPLFFFGRYNKLLERFGTDRFLPKSINVVWNREVPLFFDKWWITTTLYIISFFFVFVYFKKFHFI